MDTEALKDFVTLADCKSFSRAAASRNITQPAFSRRIQALETVVDACLIDRKAKTFRLTPSGQRFLVHARSLVAQAENAVNDARSVMTRMAEPVRLVAPSFLSKTFFPLWYKSMQRAVPGLTMRLTYQNSTGAADELRKGLADFALRLSARKVERSCDMEGLGSRVIGCDRMLAVYGRHAEKRDHLLMHQSDSYMSRCAQAILGKKVETGTVVFESASTGLLKEMAAAGFGTAVLPESLVADDIAAGFLIADGDFPALKCDILLLRPAAQLGKRAEKLWEAAR